MRSTSNSLHTSHWKQPGCHTLACPALTAYTAISPPASSPPHWKKQTRTQSTHNYAVERARPYCRSWPKFGPYQNTKSSYLTFLWRKNLWRITFLRLSITSAWACSFLACDYSHASLYETIGMVVKINDGLFEYLLTTNAKKSWPMWTFLV